VFIFLYFGDKHLYVYAYHKMQCKCHFTYCFPGPGLAFVAYPEAIARMPLSQMWGVLFFLTLITVAFDSAVSIHCVFTLASR